MILCFIRKYRSESRAAVAAERRVAVDGRSARGAEFSGVLRSFFGSRRLRSFFGDYLFRLRLGLLIYRRFRRLVSGLYRRLIGRLIRSLIGLLCRLIRLSVGLLRILILSAVRRNVSGSTVRVELCLLIFL